jgi:type I site-specific restriction-modification system R (restriction) subunit
MKYGKNLSFLRPRNGSVVQFFFFLLEEKEYQISHKCWKVLKVNGLRKRYDAVVFNLNGIEVLVECKTQRKDHQATFDQIARYNMTMNAKFWW